MGQKVNANSLRMNITDTWKSKWLSKTGFAAKLEQDTRIRAFLMLQLKKCGLVRIDIERFGPTVSVTVKTTKPGMIIGKGGGGVEDLKKKILAHLNLKKLDLKLNIEEVKDVNLQSQVVAQNIADQIEKRIAFRRAMKGAIEQVMESGALGVKIECAGRLGGAEIARSERLFKGKLPLHTLRANIDFARVTAFTTYGTIGVKVWINKGEVFTGNKLRLKGV
ncbi:MAG: 30S ribosomal protein S3 [Candidatus Doudnabacteria bacterium RIFCSPLOWO2_02_FULL_49_13]|uniref:Small ribosomal subunit protein uS3 n=1 Tax=Candidatus Doudnabacteria bacterium RIFCSPHIGHO2_12_FULL_48_16 TaxID=1817838 RepID=A0A1F5PJG8_9BACT|nr:ribosomal protein S3 [uncultured bacterium]OGE87774.1 MAG: 30S ribosomal protein S3 [Candidatus Doudnabacteria bacterium RIFCSPHIGHO2_02_FULL_49_24]OGE88136.1 MAG: 30S ribosomal protein S3 [Candidatus Doudnabacteria bacterium RIFCSPHIGHO2_01_FULL_50_67]OGE90007.1 MAG: 30S ribosomal protein S3 [Candidatus Doudnabacteria bacterium RIFCSPHIGHO2_12_FULL_48_16]OGE96580.1 MAG: 30S ribosomal protein S3 [Candidatus Doudnabacteria bacterium RIFCSPLOWO2_01_FULL_49_40]OGF03150.1 MAG: 30S ribosomal pro